MMRSAKRGMFTTFMMACAMYATPSHGQVMRMVADLNDSPSDFTPGSSPYEFVGLGDRFLFSAIHQLPFNPTRDYLILTTQGTANTTRSIYRDRLVPQLRGKIGGKACYFVFSASTLYLTDGTMAGTQTMTVEPTGPADPLTLRSHGVEWNGHLYFFCRVLPEQGLDLWRTDGTIQGTESLYFIPESDQVRKVPQPHLWDDALYTIMFFNDKLPHLVRMTETAAELIAPVMWRDSVGHEEIIEVTSFKDHLYFAGSTEEEGLELWRSDGTTDGTGPWMDLREGSQDSYPKGWCVAGDHLYFAAEAESRRMDLWRTDGTLEGTKIVHENLGTRGPTDQPLIMYWNDLLYFTDIRGRTLMRMDPAEEETEVLWTKSGESSGRRVYTSAVLGDRLIFTTVGSLFTAGGLAATDGTPEGTHFLKDLAGVLSGIPHTHAMATNGSQLMFAGTDETNGAEPWITDGTPEGTRIVLDLVFTPVGSGAVVGDLLPGGRFVGSAIPPDALQTLFVSDATPEGTRFITPTAGEQPLVPNNFRRHGGNVVYLASVPGMPSDTRVDIWVTDGSADGTFRLGRNAEGRNSVRHMDVAGGRIMASHDDGTYIQDANGTTWTKISDDTAIHFGHANGWWFAAGPDSLATDGTAQGTVVLAPALRAQHAPLNLGDGLVFHGHNDSTNIRALFRTLGTPQTTLRWWPASGNIDPNNLRGMVRHNGAVYFAYWHGSTGRVYKGDNINAQPVLLAEVPCLMSDGGVFWLLGATENYLLVMTALGPGFAGIFYMNPDTGALLIASELPGFTENEPPANFNPANSMPLQSLGAGDRFVFVHETEQHGAELWYADGNVSSGRMVRDLSPGRQHGMSTFAAFLPDPDNMRVYFRAEDPHHGSELYMLDVSGDATRQGFVVR